MLVLPQNIPSELKALPQWVLWRYEERGGKPTKPPFQANGEYADSTDPRTWTTFDKALAAFQLGGFDGIGFVLTRDVGMVGFDLDGCVDDDGNLQSWAKAIVDRLETYCEISPSGHGLRLLAYGKLPPAGRKAGPFECYSEGRYLTFTGNVLGVSKPIASRQDAIDAIHREQFLRVYEPKSPKTGKATMPYNLDDAALLQKAMSAKNSEAFRRLWEGDTSGYPSHSEADLALCSHLGFWTGDDAGRMDTLFRQSSLFRPKWDERHGKETYGQMTIRKVLAGLKDTYAPNSVHDDGNGTGGTAVDVAALLDDVAGAIRRYVVVSNVQRDAVALWVLHAHTSAAADTTPYLAVRSAEKRSGKTRLLEILELLVPKALRTENISAAALSRSIDQGATLLLDEVDSVFGKGKASETQEMLRGILDSGYRRGGSYVRMVGVGAAMTPHVFNTFGPKVLSGIGALPGTLDDRSIIVTLKRKTVQEIVERFRFRDARTYATPIRDRLAAWAAPALPLLQAAKPKLPDALDDRAQDGWEPLFAIADLAGGDWPQRARDAALGLSAGAVKEDDSLGVRLLTDIRTVYEAQHADRLPTAGLLSALNALEESPWGGFGKDGMTPRDLARHLKVHGIAPKPTRLPSGVVKGYEASQFQDAWNRYTPLADDLSVTSVTTDSGQIEKTSVTNAQNRPLVTDGAQIGPRYIVTDVTTKTGVNGAAHEVAHENDDVLRL